MVQPAKYGMLCSIRGKVQTVYPRQIGIALDTPQRVAFALQSRQKACTQCKHRDDMPFDLCGPYHQEKEVEELVQKAESERKSNNEFKSSKDTPSGIKLKQMGHKCLKHVGWNRCPLIPNLDGRGVYSQLVFDHLHLLALGWVCYFFQILVALLRLQSNSLRTYDQRLSSMPVWRVNGKTHSKFKKGVLAAELTGEDRIKLLWRCMFCFGGDAGLLPQPYRSLMLESMTMLMCIIISTKRLRCYAEKELEYIWNVLAVKVIHNFTSINDIYKKRKSSSSQSACQKQQRKRKRRDNEIFLDPRGKPKAHGVVHGKATAMNAVCSC